MVEGFACRDTRHDPARASREAKRKPHEIARLPHNPLLLRTGRERSAKFQRCRDSPQNKTLAVQH
jgi:hypothetical protein